MTRIIYPLIVTTLLALTFGSCTPDGEFDAATAREMATSLQDKIPTKEAFRRLAEQEIATLPAAEQAEARRKLEEAMAGWPDREKMEARIDEAIDELAEEAPSRRELEQTLREAADELPSGSELTDSVSRVLDRVPEGEEFNRLIEQGLNSLFESLDSAKADSKR